MHDHDIEDYEIISKLNEKLNTVTFRARFSSDNKKAIVKTFKSDFPSTQDLFQLQHEFEIINSLSSTGIIHANQLIKLANNEILVMEDFDGQSFKVFLSKKSPLDLGLFFDLALQLIDIVNTLHIHKIIHKGINPNNFLINSNTLKLSLIDFGLAIESTQEIEELISPLLLGEMLPYASPEQTGRMNRPLDHRTDLYSLGILFYEMLTGITPFISSDPLELMHYHLAKKPLDISKINPKLPDIIGMIVNKLLAKTPEERYLSAAGVKTDILECKTQWNRSGTIENFALGKHEIQDKLCISNKLYGREDQIEELFKVFSRVLHGAKELLLVSGYSGIGKTALVREIYKPIIENKAEFIAGKFDQYQRNLPYSAIIKAFQELIRKLLVENEDKLTTLKEKLLKALGENSWLIAKVIPEIELLIGKQAAAPTNLSYEQAQNRFNLVFQNFINVFASEKHPLVIFIDDLQWADSASLNLLSNILSSQDVKYLLVICAYRDNEVNVHHPFIITVENLKNTGLTINNEILQPLTLPNIKELLGDTLHYLSHDVEELSRLLHHKTNGNPFFINLFLMTLFQNNLLTFSRDQKKWMWNIDEIKSQNITDNVADLLATKITRLPSNVQDVLKFASCIGNTFDLETLSIVLEKQKFDVAALLFIAIKSDFIAFVSSGYKKILMTSDSKVVLVDDENIKEKVYYKFIHDRIQQAAYGLIPEDEKKITQLKIGRLLLQNKTWKQDEKQLLEILNHFNASLDAITSNIERYTIAKLNLKAGIKAKTSAAFQSALGYFNAGLTLLDETAWNTHYRIIFSLNKEASECEYLVGEIDQSENHFNKVLEKCKTNYDRSDIYRMKLRLYTTTGKYESAIRSGLNALKELDFNLPDNPTPFYILGLVIKVVIVSYYYNFDKLTLSIATDKRALLISYILGEMLSPGYLVSSPLFPVIIIKNAILVLQYGCTTYTPQTFIGIFGLFSSLNQFKLAFKFANFSFRHSDFYKEDSEVLIRKLVTDAFIYTHWKYPAITSLENLEKAYQLSLEAGFIHYATHARNSLYLIKTFIGRPLPEVIQEATNGLEFYRHTKSLAYYIYQNAINHYMMKLQDQDSTNNMISDEALNQTIVELKEKGGLMLCIFLYTNLSLYFYVLEDYKKSLYFAELADKNKEYMFGSLVYVENCFLLALNITKCFTNFNKKQQKQYWHKLKHLEKVFEIWAHDTCPENFMHAHQLISAEIARIKGHIPEAALLYNNSIQSAVDNGYLHHAIIATELAAIFYWNIGEKRLARFNLQECRQYALNWGSKTKAKLLEAQYSKWFLTKEITSKLSFDMESAKGTTSTDFMSVLKSSRALSSEITLKSLLKKLLHFSIENAGAERGVLIIYDTNQWKVGAEGKIKSAKVFSPFVSLETYERLPLSLITYVIRSKESVILSDASQNNQFANDPYIIKEKPKSILCAPTIRHHNIVGVLYLENNLTTNAFTPERLKLLNILAPQAAISIENARLYDATTRFIPKPLLKILHKESVLDINPGECIEKRVTVMFSDIRNYTALSERLTPNETFAFVNEYITHMAPIIRKYHGFIVQYLGDAILSLYPEHPGDAINAALEMNIALQEFNHIQNKNNKPSIKVGYGINTGNAMLGLLGEPERIDTSVVSDAINLASRIEELNKTYGTTVLASNLTFDALEGAPQFSYRIIDKVRVKGKSESIYLYEILPTLTDNDEISQRNKNIKLFTQAFDSYEHNDFSNALKLFVEYLDTNSNDRPAEILKERCRIFIEVDVPKDWDGTFTMLSK